MRFPRRRTLGGALAAAAIIAAGVSAREELGAAAGPESGVVAEVYDGDTLTLVDGRKVRLVQIDTPELGGGECYSRKARSHLLALAPRGAAVRLEADPLLETTDRYGRLLRYVLRNGMNVNLELVRRGAAAPYYYRGERGTIANELWAAVRAARAEKRGLWGACPGTPLQPERAIDTGTSGPPSSKGFSGGTCDPSYVGVCIPPPPPDLDCSDFKKQGFSRITVVGADPHRLDGDHDGVACK